MWGVGLPHCLRTWHWHSEFDEHPTAALQTAVGRINSSFAVPLGKAGRLLDALSCRPKKPGPRPSQDHPLGCSVCRSKILRIGFRRRGRILSDQARRGRLLHCARSSCCLVARSAEQAGEGWALLPAQPEYLYPMPKAAARSCCPAPPQVAAFAGDTGHHPKLHAASIPLAAAPAPG